MLLHYPLIKKDNHYYFTSDKDFTFKVSFDAEFQNQFEELKSTETEILEFSFIPVRCDMDTIIKNPDARVKTTIIHILNQFFEYNKESALIYTCYPSDKRHKARARLFNMWFKQCPVNDLEKCDSIINTPDETYYSSIIIPESNPELLKIKEAFYKGCNSLCKQ